MSIDKTIGQIGFVLYLPGRLSCSHDKLHGSCKLRWHPKMPLDIVFVFSVLNVSTQVVYYLRIRQKKYGALYL